MELRDAIASRRSVRSFDDRPVPDELIRSVVSAASFAPSALNEQPWYFRVVRNELREKLLRVMAQNTSYLEEFMRVLGHDATPAALQWYSNLGGAPVIVACTMPKEDDDFLALNKHISIGAAVQNILLAATDAGLGSCNVTFSFWVKDEICALLGIPENRTLAGLVVLGYPGDEQPPVPPHDHDVISFMD
ncbi:MAG: nitroreductase [Actinomycetota bacterium]|nr:nitroreductase [Actinomycetota bacterium]